MNATDLAAIADTKVQVLYARAGLRPAYRDCASCLAEQRSMISSSP